MGKQLELHELVSKYKELAAELDRQPTSRDFWKVVSNRQIAKHGFNNIVKAAGYEPNPANHQKSREECLIQPPKILYFDIEVSAMEVKTYSLYPDYISHKNITKEWYLYSFAGIFEGDDRSYYLDNRYASDITDDRQLIEGLHHLLSQADILVGHNIDRFDIKKFNARAIKWGLPPITPKKTYDTLKMAKRLFAFTSNSLEYIANYLDLKERKSGHARFPGDSLWKEMEAGNIEAWDECYLYNVQDCKVTQELFKKLCTYDPQVNVQAFYMTRTCICGSSSFRKDGKKVTKSGQFQAYRCKSCGKIYTEKQNLIEKDLRKMLFQ